MKKIVFLLILVLGCGYIHAQSNSVRLPKKPITSKYTDYSEQNEGFWCSAGLSAGASFISSKSACVISADIIAGYRFGEYLRLGIGVSPRGLAAAEASYPESNRKMEVPLYFDMRGNFLPQNQRMFSPYWSIDVGYTFSCGAYCSPTLGLKIGGLRNDFLIGLSYVSQQYVHSDSIDGYGKLVYSKFANMVCLKLAYEF